MKISAEDDVVIKDLDDLKEAFGGIPLVKETARLWVLDNMVGSVFKTYVNSRKGLIKLLRKTSWDKKDVIEAVERGVKIYSSRDFLDTILESKERELGKYIDDILNFYPQLIDLLKNYLMETQRRLESNRSWLSKFRSRVTDGEDTKSRINLNAVFALRCVLFHPIQRYSSSAWGFSFAENIDANIRVKIMTECRKKIFKTLKKISSREFYREITKSYNSLNTLIELADRQERFERGEMNDLILLDSLLKNLCPHCPSHYEGSENPKEFLHRLMKCPNVKALMHYSPPSIKIFNS